MDTAKALGSRIMLTAHSYSCSWLVERDRNQDHYMDTDIAISAGHVSSLSRHYSQSMFTLPLAQEDSIIKTEAMQKAS